VLAEYITCLKSHSSAITPELAEPRPYIFLVAIAIAEFRWLNDGPHGVKEGK
jgi:hypothetical protein